MTVHALKTLPPWWDHVASGLKSFEVRLDDRGYKVGDILELREWGTGEDGYSGRSVRKTITYVMPLDGWIPAAHLYVVLGLGDVP